MGLIAAGFVIGAVIGSFIGVLFARLPAGRAFAAGRSRCDACEKPLSPLDMLPLVSFPRLRGRCRMCGAPIDPTLWLIELLAALTGAAAVAFASQPAGWIWAVFGWLLLLLAALDLRHYWLPNALTALLAATGVLAVALAGGSLLDAAIGGIAGFGALEVIRRGYKAVRRRDGMGGGDPKLMGAIGIWTGWQALPFVLIGASFAGLLLIAAWKLRGREIDASTHVPFGACIAAAAVIMWCVAAIEPFVSLAAL